MPTQNISRSYLVTGGGGFLGKAIVLRLQEMGHQVKSFARNDYPELRKAGVEHIQGDIQNLDQLIKATKNCHTVFHVAAKAGVWGDFDTYYKPNVLGTENVITACQKNNCNLIYTSSPSTVFDGNDMPGIREDVPYPNSYHAHYPRTKAMAEQRVKQAVGSGLKAIILRPHLIWGPGDNHLVPRIIAKARSLRKIGNGMNIIDAVYIDNARDAHILAAEKLASHPNLSGHIYFIAQDEPLYLWDLVNQILDAAGLPPITSSIPASWAKMLGYIFEFTYKLLKITREPPLTVFMAHELATDHWFDLSAAKQDLGYNPQVTTTEGLGYLREWLGSIDLKTYSGQH